jgi:hypothetical protein
VCAAAESEGVLPLLADAMASTGWGSASVVSALAARARVLAAADLVREDELRRLLAAFGEADLGALLFKGAALAYSHYRRPDLRPRLDSDVLVRPETRDLTEQVLVDLGYERVQQFSGDLVTYQVPYIKRRQDAVVHVLDVHWRLANPQAFGQVLTYDDLLDQAEPLPALGQAARAPGRAPALLLACVHRVAHHSGADRLIWLYDVHLLAQTFGRQTWNRFASLAVANGVGAICADGLRASRADLGTKVPTATLEQLARAGSNEDRTAAYLKPNRRHAQTVASDLRALGSWRERANLVRQHAFPPARYMRDVYAPASGAPLALLYVRRAVRGARRWLTRS